MLRYVILNEGHEKSKTTDLAEDPSHAKEHGLQLNYKWYWEHCIRDAMKEMVEYVPSLDYAQLTREYTQRLEAKCIGSQGECVPVAAQKATTGGVRSRSTRHAM